MSPRARHGLTALLLLGVLVLPSCKREPSDPSSPSSGRPTPTAPPGKSAGPAVGGLPDWSLSGSRANSLGAPFRVGLFEIRPPATFRFVKHEAEAEPRSDMYFWSGPTRADDSWTGFVVGITPLSDPRISLDSLLKDVMDGLRNRKTNWSETRPERGTINGVTFARCSWSGVAAEAAGPGLAGRLMHGVAYTGVRGDQVIVIMCQDATAEYAQWLKQGELAAFSVRIADGRAHRP